jgi:hypothetical protein
MRPSASPTTLQLDYTRPDVVIDVGYQVEWADVLGSIWSGAGVTQQILNDDGSTRTIRATVPKGSTGRRFVRLKVSH